MPLQSYQSKRRKLGSSSASTSASAAAASSTSSPSSSSSASTNKPYNARPTTPAKRPSTAKLTSTTPKSTAATAAGTKKRRASIVYVDVSDDEAALPVYTVEAINKHRKAKDGHYQYLIKWEGYPESQNTWEYDRNVLDKSLIEAYWDSYADNRLREAEANLDEAKRKFVREMTTGQVLNQEQEEEDEEEQDRMDVDDELGKPQSPAAAESLPRVVRSKHPAPPPPQSPPLPMKKLPSLAPNGSPDRRHAKLRRLVTRKERDVRGSSVDTDAKDTDAEMEIDRIDDSDLGDGADDDDDDVNAILLTAYRPPTRPRASASPPHHNTPPPTQRHDAATSSIPAAAAAAASSPSPKRSQDIQQRPAAAVASASFHSPKRSQDMQQRIADMDQDEIFAFLESRDSPKPEPRFSPEVTHLLNQLTEPELVDMLAVRGIHPPDNSSYIRPSPSQHATGDGEDWAPRAPAGKNGGGDNGKASGDDGRDVDDDDDDEEDELEEGEDTGDYESLDAAHPLAGMHPSLASMLADIPELDIMEWVYDRKYQDTIDQLLGFDETSSETQAALTNGVGTAADPLVYVAYKDGSEARVSLGNLIRRAPAVAAEFLLNMRVQVPDEDMVAASQAAGGASQRVPLVQGMFGSQMRRVMSLPQVDACSSSDSDEDEQGHGATPTDQFDQDEDHEQGEGAAEEARLLDASDVDLVSGAPSPAATATASFRFVRESSQQPMDSPSKVDMRPAAPLTSPTPARPKLTVYASGESDSDGDERHLRLPSPSQTLARSSVSPASRPLGLVGHGPPVSPARATAGDARLDSAVGQQGLGGLLTSIVQSFTPKRRSAGRGDV